MNRRLNIIHQFITGTRLFPTTAEIITGRFPFRFGGLAARHDPYCYSNCCRFKISRVEKSEKYSECRLG